MRHIITILTLLFVSLNSFTYAEGVFKWKDRYGKTQYGDKPPQGVKADAFNPPPITVIDNYGKQWAPTGNTAQPSHQQQAAESKPRPSSSRYSSLKIVAPKSGQAIRANDGDVTLMLGVDPKLQKGHSIVVFLDGKQVSNSASRAINLPNLDRGEHQVHAEIQDAYKKNIISSPAISFTVLRASVLMNKKRRGK